MADRRDVLAGLAATGAAATLGTPGLVFAAAPTDRRLVLVVLRGGMDGLSAIPPFGDSAYESARGGLALPPPGAAGGAIDLNGTFGLHPALEPLAALWRERELAIAPAVAQPHRTRSHFDAQAVLEAGTAGPRETEDGWLNRALAILQTNGHRPETRLGLAVGYGIPHVLRGKTPVASWAPPRLPAPDDAFLDRVAGLYRNDAMLARALADGRRAKAMAADAMGGEMGRQRGGIRAPRQFRKLAETAGTMLRAGDGPRLAVLEIAGWDTHANQGLATGRLANNLGHLADGVMALKPALGPAWQKTAVVMISEFGRTVRMNGTRGSDHGTAGAAMIAGGAVRGGRIVGRWPGLAPDALHEGRDLRPTVDSRALFKGVLGDHYGIAPAALDRAVFPGSADVATLRGLVRS